MCVFTLINFKVLSLKKKKKFVIRIKHMRESWGVTCAFDTDVIVSSKDQGEGQKAHSDMCATSVTLPIPQGETCHPSAHHDDQRTTSLVGHENE